MIDNRVNNGLTVTFFSIIKNHQLTMQIFITISVHVITSLSITPRQNPNYTNQQLPKTVPVLSQASARQHIYLLTLTVSNAITVPGKQ